MVISPQGRRMPLEEAVTLVSYLAGSERGEDMHLFALLFGSTRAPSAPKSPSHQRQSHGRIAHQFLTTVLGHKCVALVIGAADDRLSSSPDC